MYITFTDFQVLFPNVNIEEVDFDTYEEYAEDLIYNYCGRVINNPKKDVSYACGLVIQHLRGISLLPQNLAPIASGGVNSNPGRDFMEYIPDKAKEILDRYRIIGI